MCRHCNDEKRHTYIWMKKHNKRFPATKIKSLKILNVKYVEGDETYDENDLNTMIGTYWYDPVEFMEKALNMYVKKIYENV